VRREGSAVRTPLGVLLRTRLGAPPRILLGVVLGVLCTALLGACGGVRTGDDDVGEANASTTTSTVVPTQTSAAAPTTVDEARRQEDIVAPDATADPAARNSRYCQLARSWSDQDPFAAAGYDPRDPAQLEAAYRNTAAHQQRLLDAAPPELATDLSLLAQQWAAAVELFQTAAWDYGQLFEHPSPQVSAVLQGDRATQNAVSTIGGYDSRVCGVN
jgi:hypothetical protein